MHAYPLSMHKVLLRSVLGFRPLIKPLCRLVRQIFPQGEPLSYATDALQRAATDPRDPTQPDARQAFDSARDVLAATLVEVDAHGLFSDLVVADLIGIEAGQRSGLNMTVEAPLPRSLPFLIYVNTVRRNHVVLWSRVE